MRGPSAIIHIVALLALVAAGCARMPWEREKVTVRDLAAPVPNAVATQPREAPSLRGVVLRIDFDLQGSLDKPWSKVHPGELDGLALELLRSNGLRAGVLEPADYRAFVDAIPGKRNAESSVVITGAEAVILRAGGVLQRPRTYKRATVMDTRFETLPRGEPRFLLTITPADSPDTLGVELVPQHYFPEKSLQPRSQLQSQWDGVVFRELAVRCRLTKGQVLVIAWEPPEPPEPPAPPEPPETTKVAAAPAGESSNQPATQPTPPPDTGKKPELPPTDPRLGDFLLTASRMGKPVQSVVLIQSMMDDR